MVGDIVEYLDGDQPIPVVVVKIDGPSDVVCLKQKNGHKFNTTIEYLRPIPLTPEILESIGFERYEQGGDCIVMWYGYGEEVREVGERHDGAEFGWPYIFRHEPQADEGVEHVGGAARAEEHQGIPPEIPELGMEFFEHAEIIPFSCWEWGWIIEKTG